MIGGYAELKGTAKQKRNEAVRLAQHYILAGRTYKDSWDESDQLREVEIMVDAIITAVVDHINETREPEEK